MILLHYKKMKGIDRAGSLFLRAVIKRMKELGLNNTTLAERMNVSRPYVVKVLHGDVNITLGSAARFASALEMDFCPTLLPRNKIASEWGAATFEAQGVNV